MSHDLHDIIQIYLLHEMLNGWLDEVVIFYGIEHIVNDHVLVDGIFLLQKSGIIY